MRYFELMRLFCRPFKLWEEKTGGGRRGVGDCVRGHQGTKTSQEAANQTRCLSALHSLMSLKTGLFYSPLPRELK